MKRHNMIILGCHDHEEVAVNSFKMNTHRQTLSNSNPYQNLYEYRFVRCEFCDKVSKNRYSSLIHNASHIIIPLINQKVHQCMDCLHHFTSAISLKHHISTKHRQNKIKKMSLVNIEPIDVDKYIPVSKIETDSEMGDNSNIKNRLVFEEDLSEPEVMLREFTTDCKVNIEMFEVPWFGNCQTYSKTVGYDELIRPGVYKCKKCTKMFPNRYDSIIHETTHLRLKDYKIQSYKTRGGSVEDDEADLHTHNASYNNKETTECTKCGQSFNEVEKHKIYCPMNDFDRYEMFYKEYSKIIKLCEMCFTFCKSTPLKQYVCMGVGSKMGKRFTCDRCGSLFFEVKLVERTIRYKGKERDEKKRRVLSNEERLKNIKQRLKMLK